MLEYLTSNEERRLKILEYVKERQKTNQKTTKAMVVRHLKEKKMSSSETTHNIIKELINEGKLNVEVLNSQVHFLTINEDNEFNKIYNFSKGLEKIMDMMTKPLGKFKEIDAWKLSREDYREMNDLLDDYVEPFTEAMEIIFKELLNITKNKIHFEIDKQILNDMLLKLQQKALMYGVIRKKYTSSQRLGHMIARLGHIETDPFIRAKKINAEAVKDCKVLARKFQSILENFREEFLSENEQKTKEPG